MVRSGFKVPSPAGSGAGHLDDDLLVPGVQEAVTIVRTVFPEVPVILGEIYATLCQEHAIRFSGADWVIAGPGETQLFAAVQKLIG